MWSQVLLNLQERNKQKILNKIIIFRLSWNIFNTLHHVMYVYQSVNLYLINNSWVILQHTVSQVVTQRYLSNKKQTMKEGIHGNFVLFYSNNSFFSNFYHAEFQDNELMSVIPEESQYHGKKDFKFHHVEQYMHACKAMLFKDYEVLDKILETTDPLTTKRLGRQVSNFDDDVWKAAARDIVTR